MTSDSLWSEWPDDEAVESHAVCPLDGHDMCCECGIGEDSVDPMGRPTCACHDEAAA